MATFMFIIWLGLSFVVAAAATKRSRSALAWFVLAVLLSPLIAGFSLLLLGANSRPTEHEGGSRDLIVGIGALVALGLMAKACSML